MLDRGESLFVTWFGAIGDGTTDDTVAAQAAILAAENDDLSLYFPPTSGGYLLEKLDILTGGIKIHGDHTKIIHKYDTIVEGSAGPGSTKAYPVFMIYRDAHSTEVTGFNFTSHSSISIVEAAVPTWESYLSFIVSHNADHTYIHGNNFNGTQARAVFFHGGNYGKVVDNNFNSMSMIMHVGHVQNQNFWDTGANDATTWFSPTGSVIQNNSFHGYAGAINSGVIFLSGCTKFSLKDNKITGVNKATSRVIYVYTNDFGITDLAGVPKLEMEGEISGNTVDGTYLRGLQLLGYSSNATGQMHQMMVDVHSNQITGTGVGVALERANSLILSRNHISVSGSPIEISRELDDTIIDNNHVECTGTGNNNTTIWTSSTVNANRTKIIHNTLVQPAGDRNLINATAGTFSDMVIKDNLIKCATTQASATIFNISTIGGTLDFSENNFVITGSGLANRFLWVLSGGGDVHCHRNTVLSSTVSLRANPVTCGSLQGANNKIPGLDIIATGNVLLDKNEITASTAVAVTPLKVSGAEFVSLTGNFVEIPGVLNVRTVSLVNCAVSTMTNNRLISNSTTSAVEVLTSGALEYWGNRVTNNGAGGTGYTTTGTATAVGATAT